MEVEIKNVNIQFQGKGLERNSNQVHFLSDKHSPLNWPAEIEKYLSIPHLITS